MKLKTRGVSGGATYTLTNSYSGLGLGLGLSGTAAAQKSTPVDWVLTRQADGYFTVTDAADGLELTVSGGSLSDGATVSLASAQAGSDGFANSAAKDWSVVQQWARADRHLPGGRRGDNADRRPGDTLWEVSGVAANASFSGSCESALPAVQHAALR